MPVRLKQDQGSTNSLANAIVGGFQILDAKDKAAEEKLRYEQEQAYKARSQALQEKKHEQEQAYKARSQALQEKKEELIYDPSTGTYGPSKEKQEQIKTEKTLKDLEKRQKEQGLQKGFLDIEQTKKDQTVSGRLQKAPAELKQKIGYVTSGLQNLNDYETAFRSGERQGYITPETPIIGKFKSSTDIDVARTSLEESIGRLASGGAINKNEEERFRRMIPTAADTDEQAAKKILLLRREFQTKLNLYGVSPDELPTIGVDPTTTGTQSEFAQVPNRGLLPGAYNAPKIQQAKPLDAEGAAALNWARQNPKDPRAPLILKKLGVQ